jgi:hypothetical protein
MDRVGDAWVSGVVAGSLTGPWAEAVAVIVNTFNNITAEAIARRR